VIITQQTIKESHFAISWAELTPPGNPTPFNSGLNGANGRRESVPKTADMPSGF
jgi:hypothetical protein